MSPREREAAIQVGLTSDIAPISNMIVKLALLELSRGRAGGLDSLDGDLTADFYTWANRREGVYAGLAPLGTYVDGMCILRWYGVAARRNAGCMECSAPRRPTPTRGFSAHDPAGPAVRLRPAGTDDDAAAAADAAASASSC